MPLRLIHAPPFPALRPRARLRWRFGSVSKLVRRVHLYSGLALVPFVVLYGVTAFLFNHPTVASDLEQHSFAAAELDARGRTALPTPLALATQVLASVAEPGWSLDPRHEVRFRGRLAVSGVDAQREHTLSLEESGGAGRWSARPRSARGAVERRAVELVPLRATLASFEQAARAAWEERGIAVEDLRLRSAPTLEFGLLVDGAPRRATFDLAKGELAVHAAEEDRPRSLRTFFLRLHTAHGYPESFGARTLWAVLVDLMAAAMVLWAATGLWMWWQMRLLRNAGLVAVALGSLAALLLGERMWGLLG